MVLYDTEFKIHHLWICFKKLDVWKIIRNKLLYDKELFPYFEDCVIDFTANFSDTDLMKLINI